MRVGALRCLRSMMMIYHSGGYFAVFFTLILPGDLSPERW
ncbi:putative membrane protein [Escherichia coli 7-233-03_S3_C3]|nr:putative membrane protein [Escherichia coli 7-233-03_S3_C3]